MCGANSVFVGCIFLAFRSFLTAFFFAAIVFLPVFRSPPGALMALYAIPRPLYSQNEAANYLARNVEHAVIGFTQHARPKEQQR